ncbi:ABC transporter permease [Vibrio maerlii]|uniref:ABC transporter permease n=1 Tax=Vibrio maerlii TaxID=2231648 RepID=UPI000E3C8C44|nr:thiamine ABC transporter permease [Vibrio maerlii]
MLRTLYLMTVIICIVPLLPGVAGVLFSSLGYIPPIGLNELSIDGFKQLFAWQGVWQSIGLSVFSSLASSYLACIMSFAVLQSCWNSKLWKPIELLLSPLLAMPHVAFAIGFAFLFSPTGMGMRLAHTLFDGGSANQSDLALLVKDPYALGLVVMLAFKEVPFLLLMSIPILRQIDVSKQIKVGASLGYNDKQIWWKTILPLWFNKLRFPMLAVIAYSLSVVDLALIMGPTNPPTFAVLVWQWFSDPDLSLLPRAAAGAVVLFVLASLLIAVARLVEWLVVKKCQSWQFSGRSGIALPGKTLFTSLCTMAAAMLPMLFLWSVAQRWRFPDLLPSRYSMRFWEYEWDGVMSTINDSLLIAIISATSALFLALIAHEYRLRYKLQVPGFIIAIPMLVPQLSILFGLQVTTLYLSENSYFFWVCWSHIFFAFPFVYLSLDGPWRAFDNKLMHVALSLGKTPLHAWMKVKLPLLFPAVLFAWAIGMSVSLAQYLPTLMLGAGRIATITTEAVALSSGFDRRVTAIYALWQALLPLFFFSFAIAISRFSGKKQHSKIKDSQRHESMSHKPRHP